MKLGLGTAQFGLDYGVTNASGRLTPEAISSIIRAGREIGLSVIDTAPAYGDAEERLGNALRPNDSFQLITKTLALDEAGSAEAIVRAFERSLKRLKQTKIYGLLVHHAEDLFREPELWNVLQKLKAGGRVQKIGISIYDEDEAEKIMVHYRPDLVQAPVNLLDQRLVAGGGFQRWKRQGIEIHARSIFLQGFLAQKSPGITLPSAFHALAEPIGRVSDLAKRQGRTVFNLAMDFVRSVPEIDTLIFGVCDAAELTEIGEAFNHPLRGINYRSLACNSPWIDPRNWPLEKAGSAC